jgi:hypothetical protein
MAAGENPPHGAVVDYYLPSAASEVKLEVLNAAGQVIRSYTSADAPRNPDPAKDPAAYNKLCQENPSLPDCGLPLYWPAPHQGLSTAAGMHRFIWDMHYDPIPGTAAGGRGGGGANGAVPHRTYPGVNSPWVAPGSYSVRLTADGHTQTQPVVVKLDPRVKITPAVQQIFTLSAQAEDHARTAAAAYKEARAMAAKLKADDPRLKQLTEIAPEQAPAPAEGGGGRGGRGGFGAPAESLPPANLATIGGRLVGAVMPMQGSEFAPTAAQLRAASEQEAAYTALMAKWTAFKSPATGGRGAAAKDRK